LALEVIPSMDTRIFVKIKHPIGFKRTGDSKHGYKDIRED
jgi:hypothetical protein